MPGSRLPIEWDEVDDADPHDFTMFTVPERFARLGDLHAGHRRARVRHRPLLEWAERDEAEGKESADPSETADSF